MLPANLGPQTISGDILLRMFDILVLADLTCWVKGGWGGGGAEVMGAGKGAGENSEAGVTTDGCTTAVLWQYSTIHTWYLSDGHISTAHTVFCVSLSAISSQAVST